MAFGAVLLSLPMALVIALYGYAAQGASSAQVLLVYGAMGTAILISFTIAHGLKLKDLH
ncbi:MAG: hypothetical protein AAF636_26470 [Pseudomonadota bacterium]